MEDAERLTTGWLHKVRLAIECAQDHYNNTTQLGGPGIDVEIDEVCFRAKWTRLSDGTTGKTWMRYVVAMERDGDDMVVMQLKPRFAKGGGQGGGGPIDDEELAAFVLRENGSGIPLFRVGSFVHSDSARPYRNLNWRSEHIPPLAASEEDKAELCAVKPSAWRLESRIEVLEREHAVRRELRGRSQSEALRYQHLRLSHTSVCHSPLKNLTGKKQFVAPRRIVPPPEIARALEGLDPWLRDGVTYRLGGSQKVDGHWRLFRKRAAHREIPSALAELLHRVVLRHQWAHVAGPGTDLLRHLGETLSTVRAREQCVVDLTVEDRTRAAACGGQGTSAKWRQIKEDDECDRRLAASSSSAHALADDEHLAEDDVSCALVEIDSGDEQSVHTVSDDEVGADRARSGASEVDPGDIADDGVANRTVGAWLAS
jgi:hypothetical protein